MRHTMIARYNLQIYQHQRYTEAGWRLSKIYYDKTSAVLYVKLTTKRLFLCWQVKHWNMSTCIHLFRVFCYVYHVTLSLCRLHIENSLLLSVYNIKKLFHCNELFILFSIFDIIWWFSNSCVNGDITKALGWSNGEERGHLNIQVCVLPRSTG